MHEIFSTRNNLHIDPMLHIWGWEIPVYLFLGGMVAGFMIISGYFTLKGHHKHSDFAGFYLPHISLVFLTLGMIALFLDLEHKLYTWRLYLTFQPTSAMSWGAWILVFVYPFLWLNTLVSIPKTFKNRIPLFDSTSEIIGRHPFLIKFIGSSNMIIGALLGMYTGVLLSSLGARPLWNSSMLWILFLTSGLSSAAAFVHLISTDKTERILLAKADNGFLIFELFVFVLFFVGMITSTRAHQQAADLILTGPYAAVFWTFVIIIGIIVPLIIQLLAVNKKIKHSPIAPLMVIAGGLLLRFVIVAAGQASHWTRSLSLH